VLLSHLSSTVHTLETSNGSPQECMIGKQQVNTPERHFGPRRLDGDDTAMAMRRQPCGHQTETTLPLTKVPFGTTGFRNRELIQNHQYLQL